MIQKKNIVHCQSQQAGLKWTLLLTAEAIDVKKALEQRVYHLAHSMELPGFRKGKANPALIKKRHQESIAREVSTQLVEKTLKDFIEHNHLNPIVESYQIDLEPLMWNGDLLCRVEFETYPEITLPDLDTISLERIQVHLDDAAVAQRLEQTAKEMTEWEIVQRPAQAGDAVVLELLSVTDVNHLVLDWKDDHVIQFVLGDQSQFAALVPDLLNMETDETRTILSTIPQYDEPVHLQVKLTKLSAPHYFHVDDVLAQKLGCNQGLDELKEKTHTKMKREIGFDTQRFFKSDLMDKILAHSHFDVPEFYINKRMHGLKEQYETDPDESESIEERMRAMKKILHRQITMEMICDHVLKKYELSIDQNNYLNKFFEIGEFFPDVMSYGIKRNQKGEVALDPDLDYILKMAILEDAVVHKLQEYIHISDKEVTYGEFLALNPVVSLRGSINKPETPQQQFEQMARIRPSTESPLKTPPVADGAVS